MPTLQNINNKQASSTLAADLLTATTASFSVASGEGADFPDGPSVVLINSELIWYEEKVGDQFNTLTRGYGNTTAADHTSGDGVEFKLTAEWFLDVTVAGPLNDLYDANVPAPNDGDVLRYDAAAPIYREVTDQIVAWDYDGSTDGATPDWNDPAVFPLGPLLDGDVTTFHRTDNAGGWHSFDFGSAVAIRKVRFYQPNFNYGFTIGPTTDWSNNIFSASQNLSTPQPAVGWNEVELDDLGSGQYWALNKSGKTSLGEIEFFVIDDSGEWKAVIPQGRHLIEEVTVALDGDSVEFSGIPADYDDLLVVVRGRAASGGLVSGALGMRMGQTTVDSGASAYWWTSRRFGYTTDVSSDSADAYFRTGYGCLSGQSADAGRYGYAEALIRNYASTSLEKTISVEGSNFSSTSNYTGLLGEGAWLDDATPVDILQVFAFDASTPRDWAAGSVIQLYGIKR